MCSYICKYVDKSVNEYIDINGRKVKVCCCKNWKYREVMSYKSLRPMYWMHFYKLCAKLLTFTQLLHWQRSVHVAISVVRCVCERGALSSKHADLFTTQVSVNTQQVAKCPVSAPLSYLTSLHLHCST